MSLLDTVAVVDDSGVEKLTDEELRKARDYESPEYERLCRHLGFRSDAHFVRVTRSLAIGFTVGKPSEIRNLRDAAGYAGYRIARAT